MIKNALYSVGPERHYVDSELTLEEIGNLAYISGKRVAYDEDFRIFLCSEEEQKEIAAFRRQELAFNIELLKLFDEVLERIHEKEFPVVKMSNTFMTWSAKEDPNVRKHPPLTSYLKDVIFEIEAQGKFKFHRIFRCLQTSRGRETLIRSYVVAREPADTAKCLVEYISTATFL